MVDPELKQMTVRYKDGGVIEELLGISNIKCLTLGNDMEAIIYRVGVVRRGRSTLSWVARD